MKYATAALVLSAGALTCGYAAAADSQIDRRIAADAHGSVTISNVAGTVAVNGWDRPEVQVTGALGSGVERLDLLKDGNSTIVKVILPHMSMPGRSGEARLIVNLPLGSRVELSTVSADLTVAHVAGPQALHTVSGEVNAEIGAAECEVKTVSGNVKLQGSGQVTPLRVSTVSGDVRMSRGAGALELLTVSGDIHLELKPASSLRVRTTSGDMHFDTRLTRDAKIDLESVSGDVSFGAASEAGFVAEVSSFSGDIDTCFGVRSQRTSEFGPGSTLRTTVGAGGARLRIKTLSGDVSICDK